jgi:hypothetical protein
MLELVEGLTKHLITPVTYARRNFIFAAPPMFLIIVHQSANSGADLLSMPYSSFQNFIASVSIS